MALRPTSRGFRMRSALSRFSVIRESSRPLPLMTSCFSRVSRVAELSGNSFCPVCLAGGLRSSLSLVPPRSVARTCSLFHSAIRFAFPTVQSAPPPQNLHRVGSQPPPDLC